MSEAYETNSTGPQNTIILVTKWLLLSFNWLIRHSRVITPQAAKCGYGILGNENVNDTVQEVPQKLGEVPLGH